MRRTQWFTRRDHATPQPMLVTARSTTPALLLTVALAACTPAAPPETAQSAAASEDTAAASENTASAPDEDTIPAPPDVAAPPPNAEVTGSGLASVVLTPGSGHDKPVYESGVPGWQQDSVRVHYTGWTKDGKMFDSSVVRGKTARFHVGAVIDGWTEVLQLMSVGEKRRVWIPAHLAYGEEPNNPELPAGQLTFEIELLGVRKAVTVPTPPDVAAPPADAKRTPSGLAYRVLRAGSGQRHPTAASRVSVHYSGWTTDGKLFDSSRVRGSRATFPLARVIPGWTEGVQLMVEGEETRFWIPADLAYGDVPKRPGAPAGMLVFDIELLHIAE